MYMNSFLNNKKFCTGKKFDCNVSNSISSHFDRCSVSSVEFCPKCRGVPQVLFICNFQVLSKVLKWLPCNMQNFEWGQGAISSEKFYGSCLNINLPQNLLTALLWREKKKAVHM